MKKITLAFMALIMVAGVSFGQEKAAGWAEMKKFHSFMAATFHPSEDGDLKPLREKADSLYEAAKAWQKSAIPDNYKPEETKTQLSKLVEKTGKIAKLVTGKASDDDLKREIAQAHDIFHKIAGECKKDDGHEGHGH